MGLKDLESYKRSVGMFSLIRLVFMCQLSQHRLWCDIWCEESASRDHFLYFFVLVVGLKSSYCRLCGGSLIGSLFGSLSRCKVSIFLYPWMYYQNELRRCFSLEVLKRFVFI